MDGFGTITVNATVDGYTYSVPANPITLAGAIQINVRDSASGARYDFTRGAAVNRFYVPGSGSSATTCVWGT